MASIIQDGNIKSPTGFEVAPQSYRSLETIAEQLTKVLQTEDCICEDKIDCLAVLEKLLPKSGYDYHYAEDEELENSAAFTIPEEKLVVLRASIYDGLIRGEVFARSTVIHELSHIVLKHHVTFHRSSNLGTHDFCRDSEWQAKALTAAIMMPLKVCKEANGDPILLAEICGTSIEAAIYRIDNLDKKGILKKSTYVDLK